MWNLHFHSSDLFYRMVKDYTVSCRDADGNMQVLYEVKDNFQRVNELCFTSVITDTIMVEFGETHGQEFYSVYEIRCYRE